MTARYQLVEHTADVAIRVRGRDLGELYANFAYAVCDLLGKADAVAPHDAIALHLEAPDREAMLVVLGNELIYRRDAEDVLLPVLEVERAGDTELVAVARGERADPARHELRAGLKATTWHELAVTATEDGLEAFVVFDV